MTLRRQEYDRSKFFATAKKHGAEISVRTDARVIPRAQGNAVVMQPVILLRYVFDFVDEQEKRDQRWIFEELIDDKDGPLDISGSLLEAIQKDKDLRLKVIDPTMALPKP